MYITRPTVLLPRGSIWEHQEQSSWPRIASMALISVICMSNGIQIKLVMAGLCIKLSCFACDFTVCWLYVSLPDCTVTSIICYMFYKHYRQYNPVDAFVRWCHMCDPGYYTGSCIMLLRTHETTLIDCAYLYDCTALSLVSVEYLKLCRMRNPDDAFVYDTIYIISALYHTFVSQCNVSTQVFRDTLKWNTSSCAHVSASA